MRTNLFLAAVVAGAFTTTASAFALDSSVSIASSMAPDALWRKVGDFCGIGAWHPAVEKCSLNADGNERTLALKGGGTIVERLQSRDDAKRSYTYTIVSGPLPVANYRSTISVGADAKGSAIHWVGHYDAKGAPDAEAKKVIEGIYEAGEKGLVGG